jgi:hypothetical protein
MKNGERSINVINDNTTIGQMGLTKREYFAGLAMQAIISSYDSDSMQYRHLNSEIEPQIATCIGWADELLKQLEL